MSLRHAHDRMKAILWSVYNNDSYCWNKVTNKDGNTSRCGSKFAFFQLFYIAIADLSNLMSKNSWFLQLNKSRVAYLARLSRNNFFSFQMLVSLSSNKRINLRNLLLGCWKQCMLFEFFAGVRRVDTNVFRCPRCPLFTVCTFVT
jgi:hypothetical protein